VRAGCVILRRLDDFSLGKITIDACTRTDLTAQTAQTGQANLASCFQDTTRCTS